MIRFEAPGGNTMNLAMELESRHFCVACSFLDAFFVVAGSRTHTAATLLKVHAANYMKGEEKSASG